MKPAAPPVLRAARLLDQIRERIRYKHYSLRTEQAYVQWVRMFVKWHGLRHPRDMGREEIECFLAMLANERRVAASTHNQALSALLICYRDLTLARAGLAGWLKHFDLDALPRGFQFQILGTLQ